MKINLFLMIFLFHTTALLAQNPVIQTWYTPDPAPYVHGDTVYLFVDHDEAGAQGYTMRDWQLYSTTDMVNWTYRGTPLTPAAFSWARQDNDCWASQAVERNGKWYWYVAVGDKERHMHSIGVAMADRPEGPYYDPLNKPLIPGEHGYIDPSIFVDDDKQAYLCWGNSGLWFARLNEDMISLRDSVVCIDVEDTLAFGPHVLKHDHVRNVNRVFTRFEEAPWLYKYNGKYYLEYAAGGAPEHWAYSVSDNPMGPWKYQGRIMDEAENSFTIHGGSIRFKGRNFMFYHNGNLTGGSSFTRSTCVEEFNYNLDGTIPFIAFTSEGVINPVCHLNPFKRIEAETMADSRGLTTDRTAGTEHYLTDIDQGDWMLVRCLKFQRKPHIFEAVLRARSECEITINADRPDGPEVARLVIHPTHEQWHKFSTKATLTKGIHNLFFHFKAIPSEKTSYMMDFDWWQFK